MDFSFKYTTASEARGMIRRRLTKAVHRISWAYLVLLLIFWEYLRLRGDRSWTGTVVLFGPVWASIVAPLILIPVALIFHRRSLGVLSVALIIALFPVMGFCVPWRTFIHQPGGGQHLRLLTCNVNRGTLNGAAFSALLEDTSPDIFVLQEWTSGDLRPYFVDPRWHFRVDGELFIASKYPIAEAEDCSAPSWQDFGGAARRYAIAAPAGKLNLFNIHLASPHLQFQAIIDGKPTGGHELEVELAVRREQSQTISRLASQFAGDAIIAGDFNSIAEGSIFRQSWRGFSDAYTCAGFGVGHTYFDEGAKVRIDHILAGSQWRFHDCHVGPNVGSPHRPVIADLERIGP